MKEKWSIVLSSTDTATFQELPLCSTTQDKISVEIVLAPRSEISSSMQWAP
ncbi:hypothetical protein NEUTE1DRAFT_18845, partial [Neurospora tetrasperma FGSC 2508]